MFIQFKCAEHLELCVAFLSILLFNAIVWAAAHQLKWIDWTNKLIYHTECGIVYTCKRVFNNQNGANNQWPHYRSYQQYFCQYLTLICLCRSVDVWRAIKYVCLCLIYCSSNCAACKWNNKISASETWTHIFQNEKWKLINK